MPQIRQCNKSLIHDQNSKSPSPDSAPSHHMSNHKSVPGHRFGDVKALPLCLTPAQNALKRQYESALGQSPHTHEWIQPRKYISTPIQERSLSNVDSVQHKINYLTAISRVIRTQGGSIASPDWSAESDGIPQLVSLAIWTIPQLHITPHKLRGKRSNLHIMTSHFKNLSRQKPIQ